VGLVIVTFLFMRFMTAKPGIDIRVREGLVIAFSLSCRMESTEVMVGVIPNEAEVLRG
jgi:hypothetical protein